jgi:hypothetical protein
MASTFIQLPVQDGGSGPPAGVDSFNGRTGVVVSQSGDYSAGIVSNTPAGSVSATTVQAAINELDSEKQATITGAATTIVSANLSNNVAVVSNGSGKIAGSSTTATEIGYVSGVTSSIQTQLNNKQPLDAELTAIAALATNGLLAKTGAGTAATRTLTAGSATITVTNGDGVSGNPTVDLPNSGVSAGSYGSATQVPAISVDVKGKVTSASNTAIAIPSTQVTDFTTAVRTTAVQNALFPASTVKAPSVDAVTAALSTVLINPMTTDGDTIYYDSGNQRLPIGAEDDILRVSGGLPSWQPENLTQDFGDASDGNLTLSGALTLNQIPYYNTLTLLAGAVLNPNGYPIYCRTLDLSSAPAGAIVRNGPSGFNGIASTVGQNGGTGLGANIFGASISGAVGANGASNAGTAAAAPSGATPSNGGAGGANGNSGAGGTGAAATAGAGGTSANNVHFGRFEYQFLRSATAIVGGGGGRGGASGGGDGANSSRGGPGGGAGGGIIVIYAANIITSGSTPANVITCLGGQGGTQPNAPAAGNVGGASGAGGGGGGYCYIAYVTRTGPTVNGLVNCSGGNGGNGGNGLGTGIGGQGGAGGSGGNIQTFNVTTGAGTLVPSVVGGTGVAGVGTVGGAGGGGGSCLLNL